MVRVSHLAYLGVLAFVLIGTVWLEIVLRTRVYDFYQRQKDAQRAEARSRMIGSGERSERIRTYRYKESIVADHRIDGQFALPKILDGDLDQLVDALIRRDREQRLAAL